jgi:hypothetical protein
MHRLPRASSPGRLRIVHRPIACRHSLLSAFTPGSGGLPNSDGRARLEWGPATWPRLGRSAITSIRPDWRWGCGTRPRCRPAQLQFAVLTSFLIHTGCADPPELKDSNDEAQQALGRMEQHLQRIGGQGKGDTGSRGRRPNWSLILRAGAPRSGMTHLQGSARTGCRRRAATPPGVADRAPLLLHAGAAALLHNVLEAPEILLQHPLRVLQDA